MNVFKGEVTALPPDKSISHRAALIAALADGTTEIMNFSRGFDNQSTLGFLRDAGIRMVQDDVVGSYGRKIGRVVIESNGLWSFRKPSGPLQCNNSGSTMRMGAGIMAAQPFSTTLIGDQSLMKRPMKRVADPLRLMGATVELSEQGTAPVHITGKTKLQAIEYRLQVPSAQVKSLVAFAALHAEGESRIIEGIRSRDHTELMLGLESIERGDERIIVIKGGQQIPARPFYVPADPSAACFLIALALLARGSELLLRDVCLNPTRAAYLDLLAAAHADIGVENQRVIGGEIIGDIIVENHGQLTPLHIADQQLIACIIDEIPVLAVMSAFATGEFELHNAAELRTKESDRIEAVVCNLERLGFACEQYEDGFVVRGRKQVPAGPVSIECFDDHRIAMSFAVAAHATGEELVLSDSTIAGVSFPNFFELIASLSV